MQYGYGNVYEELLIFEFAGSGLGNGDRRA
jgi:hypothetical protein